MIQPVFLVGARGCGKTTIGRALAETLGYSFADTDSHLLTSTGKSVAEIVSTEGWSGFRTRESLALKQVTAASTVVARLDASPEEAQRPTLTGKSVIDEIVDVLAAREELYRQTARHIIDATRSPDRVVESVIRVLQMSDVNSAI